MKGKITRIISNLCTVEAEGKLYNCKPRGKFYIQKLTPLVGDRVIIDNENNYILEILERKNHLDRPMIANVEYLPLLLPILKLVTLFPLTKLWSQVTEA